MWRFEVLWTLIVIGVIHFVAGSIACMVFFRKHPLLAASIPFIALAYGLIIAFISSCIVGVALAAVYNVREERDALSNRDRPRSDSFLPLSSDFQGSSLQHGYVGPLLVVTRSGFCARPRVSLSSLDDSLAEADLHSFVHLNLSGATTPSQRSSEGFSISPRGKSIF